MDVINWFGISLISLYLPLHLIFRLRSIFHIDLILEPFFTPFHLSVLFQEPSIIYIARKQLAY